MDSKIKTLIWEKNRLELLDQRKLPFETKYISCSSATDVASAIRDMVVRGAPAIGVAAAYGAAIAALEFKGESLKDLMGYLDLKTKELSGTRPTAVNLFWALDRMKKAYQEFYRKNKAPAAQNKSAVKNLAEMLEKEAMEIEKQDIEINMSLGANGLELLKKSGKKLKILTHCNAGALATAGYGTALGVIRSLNTEGLVQHVAVDETRPYLQGARLTAWELHQEEIPYFVISDNMAGYFMQKGQVDIVITGADRVAANGDTANKIGTLSISILAKHFGIPFYIAAPVSTIDARTPDGSSISIEQRPHSEMRDISGCRIMPDYIKVSNPSFDVTPNENITAIITEEGNILPPFRQNIEKILLWK